MSHQVRITGIQAATGGTGHLNCKELTKGNCSIALDLKVEEICMQIWNNNFDR
jgi:hypothetical protein